MDVRRSIRDYIVENFLFGDGSALPADSSSLSDAGIVDSVGVLELITFLEEQYSLSVDDADLTLENFDTVDGLHAFVLAGRAGAPAPQKREAHG